MLGMAKRAGELILGFEQVREAVRNAPPGLSYGGLERI